MTRFADANARRSPAGRTPVIIDAALRFVCAHRFIVTDDGGLTLFVCECCGHRAEALPLHWDTSFGQILPFPSPRSCKRGRPTRLRAGSPGRRARQRKG